MKKHAGWLALHYKKPGIYAFILFNNNSEKNNFNTGDNEWHSNWNYHDLKTQRR